MKKLTILLIIICASISTPVLAAHITGGEMIYDYLGPGTAANTTKYRITLRIIRDNFTTSSAQIPNSVWIAIFDYGTKAQYPSTNGHYTVPQQQLISVTSIISPCAFGDTQLAYTMGTFPFEVDLPNNAAGYIASYETCCRINGIQNVSSPPGTGGTGSTYVAKIPGSNALASRINSSARFPANVFLVCKNRNFTWDFSATDPDGDSLTYQFTDAFKSEIATSSSDFNPAFPSNNPPPDYDPVPYINGFTGTVPLGSAATINTQTGLISGFAPAAGNYIVCVLVREFRNGVQIAEHKKDIILKVGDCDFGGAQLPIDAVTCDGFTQTFFNLNNSPLNQTYYWDFGVPNTTLDTSTQQNPTWTYADTGVYTVKLVVNRGQTCSDSATRKLGVYPGFFPAFNSTGVCYTSPIQFTDASATNYGFVNTWKWDFGVSTINNDTSTQKNPTYTYPAPGPFNVTLIVTNSKGCRDTIENAITLIDKPIITLPFKDTLICSIDTLQLQSSVLSGNPSWSPLYNIINPNSFTPLVYPKVTTTYKVTINDQGCVSTDTVRVNVKNFVTIDVMPDTTICLTDAIKIRTTSDALSYVWTPTTNLNSATVKEPLATPTQFITKYVVNANIGKCQSKDSITITSFPYPKVNAGNDTTICFGKTATLNGMVTGNTYVWSPLNSLTNANTLTPTAQPLLTTSYILSTTLNTGCRKPAFDTVIVKVNPPVIPFAGKDTSIVLGQPLLLNGTGGAFYTWLPATFLSNPLIFNPIASLQNNQTYILRVADSLGCFALDTINITVFQTAPDIFVPTIFTPNNDNKNDILIPVPVGMKSIDFFEVYNRWGQLVFRTTQIGMGWNGNFLGTPQGIATFVWKVQGTDYTGKRIFKKGTVVLAK